MLFLGEVFLLPAIYFALQGRLNISIIFMIGMVSTLLADMGWYAIGYSIPRARLLQWKVFSRRRNTLLRLEESFYRQGLSMVFLSKFIYGTRTIAQILAGSYHLYFPKYLAVNAAGIAALLSVLIALAHFVATSFATFKDLVMGAQISFFIFIVVAVGVQLCIKKIIRKKLQW